MKILLLSLKKQKPNIVRKGWTNYLHLLDKDKKVGLSSGQDEFPGSKPKQKQTKILNLIIWQREQKLPLSETMLQAALVFKTKMLIQEQLPMPLLDYHH